MVNLNKSVKMAVAMQDFNSIKQFAESKGFNNVQLFEWMKGGNPTLVNLERLAEAFDMKLSVFLDLGGG